MYVVACTSCGAPVRVRLAQPDRLRCAHCSAVTSPSPEVQAQLDAAARLLQAEDVGRRQLSAQRARALSLARPWRFTLLSVTLAGVCFFVAFVVTYAATRLVQTDNAREIREAAWVAALVPIVLTTLIGIAVVWLAQSRLEAACAAAPPPAAGEPAECRLCGAPLSNAPERGVARCAFCQADNLVSKAALEVATQRLKQASASLAAHVATESKAASAAGRWPLAVVAFLTLVGPIASLLGVGALVTYAVSRPPEYVVLPAKGEQCIFRVHHHMLGWEYFGKDGARIWKGMTPARSDVARLAPSALVGRRAYAEAGIPGTVVRARLSERYPGLGIYLDVQHGDRTIPVHATDTCLVSAREPQELALWRGYELKDELVLAQNGEHLFIGGSRHILVAPKKPGRWVILDPETEFIDALTASERTLRFRTLKKYWTELPDYRAAVARATQNGETVALTDGERRKVETGGDSPIRSDEDRSGLPPIEYHDKVLATLHDREAVYWVATTPSNYKGFPPSALLIGRRALKR